VRELLYYNPETGKLYWRQRASKWFKKTKNQQRSWNTRYAGKEAFTSLCDGYRQGMILGLPFQAHRIIWLWMTGSFPAPGFEVHHRNGKRDDNRWSNLQSITLAQNRVARAKRGMESHLPSGRSPSARKAKAPVARSKSGGKRG
jgi:hypothetical protein